MNVFIALYILKKHITKVSDFVPAIGPLVH